MEEGTGRKERRRRRAMKKMEGTEFENSVENLEYSIQPHATQGSRKLLRRDTYTVLRSRSDFDMTPAEDYDEDLRTISSEGNNSVESRNLTYSVNKSSEDSRQGTYNLNKPEDPGEIRPVPLPRRRKKNAERDKASSDTDRDITEIDLDDARLRSDTESKRSPDSIGSGLKSSSKSVHKKEDSMAAPIPKPRTLVKNHQGPNPNSPKLTPELSKSALSSDREEEEEEEKSGKSDAPPQETEKPLKELPLVADLQTESKSEAGDKSKKEKSSIRDLIDRKGKKKKSKKTFSSMMKLEKGKMPKIATILKELKEEERKQEVPEEEDKMDFQIDSPHFPESVQNGGIYVQSKSGFYLMEREEVLKKGNGHAEPEENGGRMEDSTVTTAILFQKYWSRSMIYFHGILGGFALSHAATVTAIMTHYDYEPRGFIPVYSCLSLKIHFAFYTLTALCIVSCFDRIDIGHMNRKHWQTAWKVPSMWIILFVYLLSFCLTFSNQKTEARFDAYIRGNETEETIWETQSSGDVRLSLLAWFHTIWARDSFALLGWLLISLTEFSDFLHGHLNNMIKYAETKSEEMSLPRIARHSDYP